MTYGRRFHYKEIFYLLEDIKMVKVEAEIRKMGLTLTLT